MEIIKRYFPALDPSQTEQFMMLGPLYREWNEKINVISRKDIENLYVHHVLHSLAIAKFISFKPGTRVLDAGTGGGFPGIPLAIMFPSVNFTLNDSIVKKIKVVHEISAAAGLKNVKTLNCRAEDINDKFDFIVSRAVTAFPKFYSWTGKLVRTGGINDLPNGILYLKGGDIEEEFREFRKRIRIFEISSVFSEEFFLTKKLIHFT
jgi:16S rRNA (guanine527-N7)-methyltransferase